MVWVQCGHSVLYLIIRQSEKPAQLLTRVGWLARWHRGYNQNQNHNQYKSKFLKINFKTFYGEKSSFVDMKQGREKSIFVTEGAGGRFWPIIDEIKAGPLTNYTLLPYFCGPNNYFGPHFYKQSIFPPRTNLIKRCSPGSGNNFNLSLLSNPKERRINTREVSSI